MMLIRHSILSCPLPRGQWATALEAPSPLPVGYLMFLTQSHHHRSHHHLTLYLNANGVLSMVPSSPTHLLLIALLI